jgi:hypothetical protein
MSHTPFAAKPSYQGDNAKGSFPPRLIDVQYAVHTSTFSVLMVVLSSKRGTFGAIFLLNGIY